MNILDQAGTTTWDEYQPPHETFAQDADNQWEDEEAQLRFYDKKFRLTQGHEYRVRPQT